MGNYDIGQFILYMVALVFSLSLHEAGHAWMSNRFGDDLARLQGRISLNPVSHVDPIGTLLFPAIAFFTHAPLLGWARPTPVNPLRWRDKRVANFWVSIAGVLCNLLIAIVAGITIRVLSELGLLRDLQSDLAIGGVKLLTAFFTLNVGLFVFNLLPIPPLDGSKILGSILPASFEPALEALEQYGFILLFIAVFTRVLNPIFGAALNVAWSLVFIGT
ncbi:MAG TPA: site-2 protease family protein [Pyrinomonadaceae bacterium]|nr:site-2 protease family protein [Pyrinomonadaceae bacterium]